jgi:pyruvate dehydrogenase complex dehydrogenase (E1) component
MMNTVEVKAALKAKDAEIRSLVRGGKELQKTIDKLRKTVEKLDKPSTAS